MIVFVKLDLFFIFFVFSIQSTENKICHSLDSNCGPLVSGATALPNEAQSVSQKFSFFDFSLHYMTKHFELKLLSNK